MKESIFIWWFMAGLLIGCSSDREVKVGEIAPSFKLKSLDGTWVQSHSLKGNAVILNFWQTTCGPCLKEIPDLEALAAGSGASVVGVNLSEDEARVVRPFVERMKITYTILLGDEEVFQQFNGFAIPYTLVLDPHYRIFKIYRGPVHKAVLEQDVKEMVQE